MKLKLLCGFVVIAMVFLLACAPPILEGEEAKEPVGEPSEPAVDVTEETIVPAAQEKPKVPSEPEVEAEGPVGPGPVNRRKLEIAPYSQLGCEQLASVEEFASACGHNVEKIERTARIGTKNCYLSFTSRELERRTAGIVLTAYDSSEKTLSELQRRADLRKGEITETVGQGVYKFVEIERNNLEFALDNYIVALSADEVLCSEDGLFALAQIVADRLE
jgi:hypothetical protein